MLGYRENICPKFAVTGRNSTGEYNSAAWKMVPKYPTKLKTKCVTLRIF